MDFGRTRPLGPPPADRRWAEMRPLDYRPPTARPPRSALKLVMALGLLLTVALAAGALLLPAEHAAEQAEPVGGPSQRPLFQASIDVHVPTPAEVSTADPVAVAAMDGHLYIAGTDGTILELDGRGQTRAHLTFPGLQRARALDAHGGALLAASAYGSQVLVLRPNGTTERVISLPPTFDGAAAWPVGLARSPDGHMFVADVTGQRLLVLDSSGRVLQTFGGERDGPRYLLEPGAVAIAPDGTVFLADAAAGRVYRVTESLPFPTVDESVHPGAQIYEPRALAVDGRGRLYVADRLLKEVQVFAADGSYLGLLASDSPNDPAFHEPLALFAEDDTLYVVDGAQGLLIFHLP